MPAAIRSPNTFETDKLLLKEKLDQVSARIKSGELLTEGEILNAVFKAYREVYENSLGPEEISEKLDPFDVRDEERINRPFVAAARNVRALVKMHNLLQVAQRGAFNYLTALSEMATGRVNRAATRTLDIKLLSGILKPAAIVAGDDFLDGSRIDPNKSAGTQAEILPSGGGVSLSRVRSTDVLAGLSPTIHIAGPAGMYEGRQYGVLSPAPNVNPEGTNFLFDHVRGTFNNKKVEGLSEELRIRYQALQSFYSGNTEQAAKDGLRRGLTPQVGLQKARSKGTFAGLTTDEWEQIADNFHWERSFAENTPDTAAALLGKNNPSQENSDRTLSPFTDRAIILKGDPGEVQAERLSMLDGDPDTFWEAELVIDTAAEYSLIKYDDKTFEPVPVRTLEQITEDVQSRFDNDARYLDVSITIDMGDARELNFITILPLRFDATQVPEVVSIEHSLEGVEYTEIPEVRAGGFERKLVPDVNEELSDSEVALSLSANKYDYRGQGVFGFQQIKAQFIRITLREQRPVPVHYQTLTLTLQRKTTFQTKRTTLLETKRDSRTVNNSQLVELDYPTSLETILGETDLRELKLGGGNQRTNRSTFSSVPTALLPVPIETLPGVKNPFEKVRRRVKNSDWEITSVEPKDRYDKARYAIGVREIRLFSYEYAVSSEVVSTPFFAPKPISSVTLEADESIPETIEEDFPIRYYFSLDDGTTWNEISPLNTRPRFSGPEHVPQIYHINSSIPADQRDSNVGFVDTAVPSRVARFKAVLTRGTNPNVSPILKSYRLRLVMEGSL